MDKTVIACTIIAGVFSIVAAFGGAVIGAIIQHHFVRDATRQNLFDIARGKFVEQMKPFFNEINTLPFEEPIDVAWSCTKMVQMFPIHRGFIDEFRVSVFEAEKPRFNALANKYCPRTNNYSEENVKKFLSPDGSTEREKQIRKEIRNNLAELREFNI